MFRKQLSFIGVVPMPGYLLTGGVAFFDVKPYLEKGNFKVLKDIRIFKTVSLDQLEGVAWSYANLSLSKDTIIANMF